MPSTIDLFVCLSNPARSALIANGSSQYSPALPEFVLRDPDALLRVRFFRRDSSTQLITQVDYENYATLGFGAKKTADVADDDAVLLFAASPFTRNATDEDDICFEAPLNLNTDEFIEAFGTETTLTLRAEFEEFGGRTVAQFDALGVHDVITGTEAPPISAVPPYPTAPTADSLLGSNAGGTAWAFFSLGTFARTTGAINVDGAHYMAHPISFGAESGIYVEGTSAVFIRNGAAIYMDSGAEFGASAGAVFSGTFAFPADTSVNGVTIDSDGIAGLLTDGGQYIGGLHMEEPPQQGPSAPDQFPIFSGTDGFFFWPEAAYFRTRLGLTSAATGNAAGLTSGTIDPARLPALALTATLSVANAAARLALSAAAAQGKIVVEADTGKSYGLITRGNPSTSGDWVQVGDRDIVIADVSGLQAALDAKVATTRTVSAAGLATGGGDLSANRTITVTAATNAEAVTGTGTTQAMTPAADRAALLACVDPIAATRQGLLGWAYSDGTTTNRRIEWQPGAAGNVAGQSFSEVGHVFRMPSATVVTLGAMIFQWSAYAGAAQNTEFCLTAYVLNDDLILRQNGAASSDNRILSFAGVRTAWSGKIVRLDVVVTSSTTAPEVYLNGVLLTGGSLTTSGTPPNWAWASLAVAYRFCGPNFPLGHEFRPGSPINRALVASEITQMVQTGALLPRDRAAGTVAPLADPTLASDSGAIWLDPYAKFVVGGGTITGTGTVQYDYLAALIAGGNRRMEAGQTVRYSITVTAVTGGNWVLQQGGNGAFIHTFSAAGTYSGTYTASANDSTIVAWALKQIGVGAGSITVSAVSFIYDGAIIQPEITRTAQALDFGANRIRGLMTAGMRSLTVNDPTSFEFTVTTSGAFVTGASTNPLFFEPGMILSLYAMADTAGADLTFRRNSSSTQDLVTALTDIATANVWTPLSVIDAQRAFAAGETLWGSASAGTIRVRGTWTRN